MGRPAALCTTRLCTHRHVVLRAPPGPGTNVSSCQCRCGSVIISSTEKKLARYRNVYVFFCCPRYDPIYRKIHSTQQTEEKSGLPLDLSPWTKTRLDTTSQIQRLSLHLICPLGGSSIFCFLAGKGFVAVVAHQIMPPVFTTPSFAIGFVL